MLPTMRIAASTIRPPSVEPVASLTRPTRYGPTKPPMLPIELIIAMPAAAAAPLSRAAGIVQKTPWTPSRKNRPTASAGIAATGPTTVLATNATAASARQAATTRLRSPVRSE